LIAIILADGSAASRAALRRVVGDSDVGHALVIAADGGARQAAQLGLTVDVVVGDGDSLSPGEAAELRAAGAEFITHPRAKEQSDTELAVIEALSRGARRIAVLGAFGGRRLEHTLANILLLASPPLAGRDVALVDESTTVRVMGDGGPAELLIDGAAGDYVSLLPLSERVEGVTTGGLAFPLLDEDLLQGPTRGLSNEMTTSKASVRCRAGRLAVIHTQLSGAQDDQD
jgi:thiamine pyrophosphokinase